jgi:hypothetical protein
MNNQAQKVASEVSNLVGALLEELAHELPEDVHLEGVRTDLLAASKSYGQGEKQDLALRFYLAFRSMLHEFKRLQKFGSQKPPAAASPAGDSYNPPLNAGEPESYTSNI